MKRGLDIISTPDCCGPGVPPLAADTARQIADRFKALGDPTRLAIITQLASAAEICVCHLVPDAGLSQPTISHHLKMLRDAGLVTSERRGTWAYYRLVPGTIDELADLLAASGSRLATAG